MRDLLPIIIDWFLNNIQWIFSGVGVLIISFIINRQRKKTDLNNINQKIEKDSKGIQVGRDFIVNLSDSDNDIHKYLNSLKKLEGVSDGRIKAMPNDLKCKIELSLKNGPKTIEEMSNELGISQKMGENLLKNLVNKGIVKKVNNLYYFNDRGF